MAADGPTRGLASRHSALLYATLAGAALGAIVLRHDVPRVDGSWLLSFAVLLAVSACAHAARSRAVGWTPTYDASFVVELCALVLIGPLGAVAVAYLPVLATRAVEGRLRRDGTVGDLAAIGWECAVGAGVLSALPGSATDVSALPTLFSAGIAMVVTGFIVGPLVYGLLHGGRSLRAAVRPLTDALPVHFVIVAGGALLILATGPLGLLALAGFALAVPLPSLMLGELTRFASVHGVERSAARGAYARAIADELRLPRSERRVLETSLIVLAGGVPRRPVPGLDLAEALFYWEERWDGEGGPGGLTGEWIPRVGRVLAVAEVWSQLTADGTPALDHEEALLGLRSQAGTRFDPRVVDAAERVVAAEAPYAHHPAFVPRLHEVPLPRPVRRGALPRVLHAVAGR